MQLESGHKAALQAVEAEAVDAMRMRQQEMYLQPGECEDELTQPCRNEKRGLLAVRLTELVKRREEAEMALLAELEDMDRAMVEALRDVMLGVEDAERRAAGGGTDE